MNILNPLDIIKDEGDNENLTEDEKKMSSIDKADMISELFVAGVFVISFFIGAATAKPDSNMSALLIAGIATIVEFLSEKYKLALDPTAEMQEAEPF